MRVNRALSDAICCFDVPTSQSLFPLPIFSFPLLYHHQQQTQMATTVAPVTTAAVAAAVRHYTNYIWL